MPGLGETVSELMLRRMRDAATKPRVDVGNSQLSAAVPAGSNPGHLGMHTLVPAGLPRGAPLVVVLHGCTQSASSYDFGSGWSALAQRHGFALLYPEQRSANNANTCFNWFQPDDICRDRGEAASIAQMVQQMISQHGLDPARVYVTGLSAGGAMTAVMLATYPELFAGGAIIAGLPFGAAGTLPAALDAMRHVRPRPASAWGDLVRQASPHRGARPTVQVWHGAADTTVRAVALDELAKQWCDVAGLGGAPETEDVNGTVHQTWRGAGGHAAVETFLVPRLGHGVPLDCQSIDLDESVGTPSPYMLEAGIGSTRRIAQSWGLLTQAPAARAKPRDGQPRPPNATTEVGSLIQSALRRAGLNV